MTHWRAPRGVAALVTFSPAQLPAGDVLEMWSRLAPERTVSAVTSDLPALDFYVDPAALTSEAPLPACACCTGIVRSSGTLVELKCPGAHLACLRCFWAYAGRVGSCPLCFPGLDGQVHGPLKDMYVYERWVLDKSLREGLVASDITFGCVVCKTKTELVADGFSQTHSNGVAICSNSCLTGWNTLLGDGGHPFLRRNALLKRFSEEVPLRSTFSVVDVRTPGACANARRALCGLEPLVPGAGRAPVVEARGRRRGETLVVTDPGIAPTFLGRRTSPVTTLLEACAAAASGPAPEAAPEATPVQSTAACASPGFRADTAPVSSDSEDEEAPRVPRIQQGFLYKTPPTRAKAAEAPGAPLRGRGRRIHGPHTGPRTLRHPSPPPPSEPSEDEAVVDDVPESEEEHVEEEALPPAPAVATAYGALPEPECCKDCGINVAAMDEALLDTGRCKSCDEAAHGRLYKAFEAEYAAFDAQGRARTGDATLHVMYSVPAASREVEGLLDSWMYAPASSDRFDRIKTYRVIAGTKRRRSVPK